MCLKPGCSSSLGLLLQNIQRYVYMYISMRYISYISPKGCIDFLAISGGKTFSEEAKLNEDRGYRGIGGVSAYWRRCMLNVLENQHGWLEQGTIYEDGFFF